MYYSAARQTDRGNCIYRGIETGRDGVEWGGVVIRYL